MKDINNRKLANSTSITNHYILCHSDLDIEHMCYTKVNNTLIHFMRNH